MPAFDGINEKVDFFGGSIANRTVYGAEGSVSIPLAGLYGLQLDGNLGSLGSNGYGAGAGHLFWRNPRQGLLGVYGSFTEWNLNGGVWVFEGVTGEDSFHGIWGGLKFYFGHADKPLIARHRQDDPPNWTTDTLFSIINNSTGSTSTTTTQFCKAGEVLVAGKCTDVSAPPPG
jgi:hypothetical protein